MTNEPTTPLRPVPPPRACEAHTDPTGAARYALHAEIARGGMGAVHRATDRVLAREVAVKVLRDGRGNANRFVAEAQITGRLQHPAIPPVHDLGTLPDGRPFLAMKLIQGRTLAALLADRLNPSADLPRFIQVFEQVCQAVGFAHRARIIHRDLKPANIMVGEFGEVQVMDWGLAKVVGGGGAVGGAADGVPSLPARFEETQAGAVLGTPSYMAPEQARGEIDLLDARTDVFALGALLAIVLTGSPPFTGLSTAEVVRLAATGDVSAVSARLDACGADPELVTLAKHCLSPNAADRPADGGAVAEAVAAYHIGVEDRLRHAEQEKAAAEARAAEGRKRRQIQLALAATVCLLLLGGSAAVLWLERQAAVRREERAREQERTRLNVEATLVQVAGLRQFALWRQADDAIQRALDGLDADADPDLRARLEQAGTDTRFAARLNECRSRVAAAGSPREAYAEVFRENGFDLIAGDETDLAQRLAAHPLRNAVLNVLDHWGLNERDAGLRARIWNVTAAATGQPWRRELTTAIDKGARLKAVLGRLNRDEVSPALLGAIGQRLDLLGEDGLSLIMETCLRHPADFWLHATAAQTLQQVHHKRYDEAIGHFRAAMAIQPESAYARFGLGQALKNKGNLSGAEAAYRESIRLDPKKPGSYFMLVLLYRKKQEPDRELALWREAAAANPERGWPHEELGGALLARGDLDGAIACFEQALRIEPGRATSKQRLAHALSVKAAREGPRR